MKKVLITGVTGFIGRYVARLFSEKGWSVIGVGISPPENAPLMFLSDYYSIRLPNPMINEILKKHQPRLCIHCAGRASVGLSMIEPASDFYSSTVLVFEMLDALRLNVPDCKFIFLSSAAVYGNPKSLPVSETQQPDPVSPYGFHKWQCEQLCTEFSKIYEIPTASVRIFSAYGPGLRRQVIWDMCEKTLVKKSLILNGTGEESRDFIHAYDIAKALGIIAESAQMRGEVYNLGSGREVSISKLANMVLESLGSNITPQFDGVTIKGNPLNWRADIAKIGRLGFKPSISLEDGIKSVTTWCKMELIDNVKGFE